MLSVPSNNNDCNAAHPRGSAWHISNELFQQATQQCNSLSHVRATGPCCTITVLLATFGEHCHNTSQGRRTRLFLNGMSLVGVMVGSGHTAVRTVRPLSHVVMQTISQPRSQSSFSHRAGTLRTLMCTGEAMGPADGSGNIIITTATSGLCDTHTKKCLCYILLPLVSIPVVGRRKSNRCDCHPRPLAQRLWTTLGHQDSSLLQTNAKPCSTSAEPTRTSAIFSACL